MIKAVNFIPVAGSEMTVAIMFLMVALPAIKLGESRTMDVESRRRVDMRLHRHASCMASRPHTRHGIPFLRWVSLNATHCRSMHEILTNMRRLDRAIPWAAEITALLGLFSLEHELKALEMFLAMRANMRLMAAGNHRFDDKVWKAVVGKEAQKPSSVEVVQH